MGRILWCDSVSKIFRFCVKTKRFPSAVQTFTISPIDSVTNMTERATNNTMIYWSLGKNDFTDNYFQPYTYLNMLIYNDFPKGLEIISDNVTAIGCSIFKDSSRYLVICTYDNADTLYSKPLYEVREMDSECKTGMNPKYKGLCNVNEFPINATESLLVQQWVENGKNKSFPGGIAIESINSTSSVNAVSDAAVIMLFVMNLIIVKIFIY